MTDHAHPGDERLAALAGGDPEARADPSLVAHADSCARCAGLVGELATLRRHLSALPEIDPPPGFRAWQPATPPAAQAASRPPFADRLAGIFRGALTPAMAAGASLVFVGAVGAGLSGLNQGLADRVEIPAAAPMLGESPAAGEGPREELRQPELLAEDDGDAPDEEAAGDAGAAEETAASPAFAAATEDGPVDVVTDDAADAAATGRAAAGGDFGEATGSAAGPRTTVADEAGPAWALLIAAGATLLVVAYVLRRALPRAPA